MRTRLAPATVRERKMRSGTSGLRTRDSTATNSAASTTVAAASSPVRAVSQPWSLAWRMV